MARRAQPRAVGKTFHVIDPAPITARTVFELVAEVAGTRSRAATSRARSRAPC